MSTDVWDKYEDGSVRAQPGVGWRIAVAPAGAIVRLEFAEDPDNSGLWREASIQVHFNLPLLRQLGLALVQTADILEAEPTGTQQ